MINKLFLHLRSKDCAFKMINNQFALRIDSYIHSDSSFRLAHSFYRSEAAFILITFKWVTQQCSCRTVTSQQESFGFEPPGQPFAVESAPAPACCLPHCEVMCIRLTGESKLAASVGVSPKWTGNYCVPCCSMRNG